MGGSSSKTPLEDQERENIENDIRGIQRDMEVHSRAHNLSAEYYGNWKSFLVVLSLIVGGLSAVYKGLGVKVPLPDDPKSIMIAIGIIAIGVGAFVIRRCHSAASNLRERHFRAEKKCQTIANRARSVLKEAHENKKSTSYIKDRYESLLKDSEDSSEIGIEPWAIKKASKQ